MYLLSDRHSEHRMRAHALLSFAKKVAKRRVEIAQLQDSLLEARESPSRRHSMSSEGSSPSKKSPERSPSGRSRACSVPSDTSAADLKPLDLKPLDLKPRQRAAAPPRDEEPLSKSDPGPKTIKLDKWRAARKVPLFSQLFAHHAPKHRDLFGSNASKDSRAARVSTVFSQPSSSSRGKASSQLAAVEEGGNSMDASITSAQPVKIGVSKAEFMKWFVEEYGELMQPELGERAWEKAALEVRQQQEKKPLQRLVGQMFVRFGVSQGNEGDDDGLHPTWTQLRYIMHTWQMEAGSTAGWLSTFGCAAAATRRSSCVQGSAHTSCCASRARSAPSAAACTATTPPTMT